MKLWREISVGYQEKILQRVLGMVQVPQGSGHSPKLSEFKKFSDSALRQIVWFLCGPMWRQELVLMILKGAF